ncbi:MAG: DUF805 domain-containing protein [Planctomycetaceae bacterium]|nr:DUF805 domain-containing protein [Planctomycetaceae bacterium]
MKSKMVENYINVLTKYVDFTGRAGRREYWLFVLANLLIGFFLGLMLGTVSGAAGVPAGSLSWIINVYQLAVLLPSIFVGVRRLHDTGRSGWWLLIVFIPIIGALILIVWYVQDSDSGSNQYGPRPR